MEPKIETHFRAHEREHKPGRYELKLVEVATDLLSIAKGTMDGMSLDDQRQRVEWLRDRLDTWEDSMCAGHLAKAEAAIFELCKHVMWAWVERYGE